MRDNQQLMTQFVKLIERYPEIYDQNLDSYRTRFSEIAWSKVASLVRSEMNEECTVDELKIKWKGIRSSFNRYKAKLYQNNPESSTCKKYYLYDHLRFLEPHIRLKGVGSPVPEQERSESTHSESCNYVNVEENIEEPNDYTNIEEWNHIEIKPDVTNRFDKEHETESLELPAPIKSNNSKASYSERIKKRKTTREDKDTDDDNEDLQFFKSILPDIRNFTIREKRKLKMGILQLIDDLENERKSEGGS